MRKKLALTYSKWIFLSESDEEEKKMLLLIKTKSNLLISSRIFVVIFFFEDKISSGQIFIDVITREKKKIHQIEDRKVLLRREFSSYM